MSLVPEMIVVPRKVRSLVLCEAMFRKAAPGKPSEMAAAATEMAAAATEMAAAASEMTAAATEMAAATTSPTMCERAGGRDCQKAGQNKTDK
jgi:hypothetical protein